jgi:hypothetical protein
VARTRAEHGMSDALHAARLAFDRLAACGARQFDRVSQTLRSQFIRTGSATCRLPSVLQPARVSRVRLAAVGTLPKYAFHTLNYSARLGH